MSDREATGAVPDELGDFTATRRLVPISALAVVIGALSAFVALALIRLIALFTNLFFFQRLSVAPASPEHHALGLWVVAVPVVGALVIGVMARYGSERIRGHGIPEALEAILTRGSRVEPRVAFLKPIAAAISIGSGGPFGAEGPIIMTGGAFGSMIAQLFHLTAAERKTLLVAGAAAGMSATFAAPIASVCLAVELLLFELKPRSFVPVSLASATAMLLRYSLLGPAPVCHAPHHDAFVGTAGLLGCVAMGVVSGALAWAMTASVYASEDFFKKLPLHWMWWPAIGGVAIGLGGLICPRALGVGFDTIGGILNAQLPVRELLLLVLVKWFIWSFSLGSGTSGGVLAPLLMIGSALGGLAGQLLPDQGPGFWQAVALGAVLGGTMRSPLTGIVFALELTQDQGLLLPLLVAATVSHGFTVLVMKRSILTEKVARRGFHITREYGIDPLEVLFVRDVMEAAVVQAPALAAAGGEGVVSLTVDVPGAAPPQGPTAFPDEPLRIVVERMADTGTTRFPVLDRTGTPRVVGQVTLEDMLKARVRHLEEEQRRERVLPLRALFPLPARLGSAPSEAGRS